MGGHVDGAQLPPPEERRQGVDVEAVVVDGNRLELGSGEPKGGPHRWEAELLDGDHVPRRQERPGDEIQGVLAAARDQHVFGRRRQTPGVRQHGRQLAAQALVAARIPVAEELSPVPRQCAMEGARQRLGRQEAHVGDAAIHHQRAARIGRGHRQRGRRRRHRVGRERRRSEDPGAPRQLVALGDKRASALPRPGQPLYDELAVTGDDRVPMDAEVLGEDARPRQRVAGL